jgi:hypothetical protein
MVSPAEVLPYTAGKRPIAQKNPGKQKDCPSLPLWHMQISHHCRYAGHEEGFCFLGRTGAEKKQSITRFRPWSDAVCCSFICAVQLAAKKFAKESRARRSTFPLSFTKPICVFSALSEGRAKAERRQSESSGTHCSCLTCQKLEMLRAKAIRRGPKVGPLWA